MGLSLSYILLVPVYLAWVVKFLGIKSSLQIPRNKVLTHYVNKNQSFELIPSNMDTFYIKYSDIVL